MQIFLFLSTFGLQYLTAHFSMRIEGSLDNDVPLTVGNHRDESGEPVDGRRDFAMEGAPRFGQHFQGDIGKIMYWDEGSWLDIIFRLAYVKRALHAAWITDL